MPWNWTCVAEEDETEKEGRDIKVSGIEEGRGIGNAMITYKYSKRMRMVDDLLSPVFRREVLVEERFGKFWTMY